MPTALSDDLKLAKRLLKLQADVGPKAKEIDAIKAQFKVKAGGKDLTVEGAGVKLTVVQETQERVDLDALRASLGAKVDEFQKVTPVTKVSVKKIAKKGVA